MPRYSEIWDVRIVLNLLRKMSPVFALGLKDLTLKLVMLIALVSGQRVQTLQKLRTDTMKLRTNSVTFTITQVLKQSRPGSTGYTMKLHAYPAERRLCVVTYLKHYLQQTKPLRAGEKALFLSFKRPHKAVSRDTISRWLKLVMNQAGLDTEVYTAHSTRTASTSAACLAQVPVDEILQTAGWAKEQTFKNFYKKPILAESTFAHAILKRR